MYSRTTGNAKQSSTLLQFKPFTIATADDEPWTSITRQADEEESTQKYILCKIMVVSSSFYAISDSGENIN